MEQYKILLPRFKKIDGVDQDINLKLNIDADVKLTPLDPIQVVVNENEQEKLERDVSTNYRFLGEINLVASNVLFNIVGSTKGSGLNDLDCNDPNICLNEDTSNGPRRYNDEINKYTLRRDSVLIDRNGWFGYIDDVNNTAYVECVFKFMDPSPTRVKFKSNEGNNNWDMFIGYSFDKKQDVPFKSGLNNVFLSDGLPISFIDHITVGNKKMLTFHCPINHGLKLNDVIKFNWTEIEYLLPNIKEFTVTSIGLEDGTSKDNVFSINEDISNIDINFDNGVTFNRVVNGIKSQYYFRKIKNIANQFSDIDFDFQPNAYARNLYGDSITTYTSTTDIDIEGFRDNLNRPLVEVFYGFNKKQDYDDINNEFWNLPVACLDTYYHTINDYTKKKYGMRAINKNDFNYDKRFVFPSDSDLNNFNRVVTLTGSTGEFNINLDDEYFLGNLVEYNEWDLKEFDIMEIEYRINTINREINGCYEGYVFKPFYKKPIKDLSDDIEIANINNTINIPDYAIIDSFTGLARFRDILDNSFSNDSEVNFPFTNNFHYVYERINFFLRRQDPYNIYGKENNGDFMDKKLISVIIPDEIPEVGINDFRNNIVDDNRDVRLSGCYHIDGLKVKLDDDNIIPISNEC